MSSSGGRKGPGRASFHEDQPGRWLGGMLVRWGGAWGHWVCAPELRAGLTIGGRLSRMRTGPWC